jgi:hypothetical protein
MCRLHIATPYFLDKLSLDVTRSPLIPQYCPFSMSLPVARTARTTRSTAIAGPRVPQAPSVAASGSRPVRVLSITASAPLLTPPVTKVQPRLTHEGRAWVNQAKAPPRDRNSKLRVADQGPNGDHCLITHTKLDTQGCHVVGREYGNRNNKVCRSLQASRS